MQLFISVAPELSLQAGCVQNMGSIVLSENAILFWNVNLSLRAKSTSGADPEFPGAGAPTPKGNVNLLFGQIFLKTAWKWKKFWQGVRLQIFTEQRTSFKILAVHLNVLEFITAK